MKSQHRITLWGVGLIVALMGCQVPTPSPAPSEKPRATITPQPTVPTALPTFTIVPTLTSVPKPAPEVPSDKRWQELMDAGFVVVDKSATDGEFADNVRAYLLTNGTRDSIMANRGGEINFRESLMPGTCVLAFFHWDGANDTLIQVIGEKESPFWCEMVHWDQPNAGVFFRLGVGPDDSTRRVLQLRSTWSDMNGNGVPELTVVYSGCTNDCQLDYDSVSLYEVSSVGVKNIADGIEGALVLWPNMLVAQEPPAFNSVEIDPYWADQDIWRTRIYVWENDRFVDRSQSYPEYFQDKLHNIRLELEKRYGSKLRLFDTVPFLTILAVTNWSGLSREDSLKLFLDVTAPEHWPGTDPDTSCWLQLARGYAQVDFAADVPFRIYPMIKGSIGGDEEIPWLANEARTLAELGYDTGFCPTDR